MGASRYDKAQGLFEQALGRPAQVAINTASPMCS